MAAIIQGVYGTCGIQVVTVENCDGWEAPSPTAYTIKSIPRLDLDVAFNEKPQQPNPPPPKMPPLPFLCPRREIMNPHRQFRRLQAPGCKGGCR